MNWRPISGRHAIERVRIVLTVEQPVRPKVLNRLGTKIEARVDLGFEPRLQHQGQAITFQMTPNGPVAIQDPQAVNGWEFRRQAPVERDPASAQIVEVFSIMGQTLTYDTAAYTSWPEFKERLSLVAGDTLEQLLADDEVSTIALEYHDRFYFDGDPRLADPTQFLALPAGSISDVALEEAELWHLYKGWFEPVAGGKLLLNQNLDAQDGIVGERALRSVQIVTRAEARRTAWPLATDDLYPHLNVMHKRVNELFRAILTSEMQGVIGLAVETVQ